MTSTREGRSGVALSFAVFILIGANDGALGVLLPSIQQFYRIDKATVAILFLFGTAGFLSAAFSSGPLVDKLGTRRFLLLGSTAFLCGMAGLSLTPTFPLAMALYFVLAFGGGIMDAGLNTYVARLPNNTALLNYLHAFYGLGALLGPIAASGFLAAGLGWNSAYVLWAGISLLLIVGVAGIFQARGAVHEHHTEQGGNVLAAALRLSTVWIAALFLLFYVGGEVSIGNWGYSLLTEERHQAPLAAGWTISGFWMGLTLGRALLGRLGARIGDKALVQLCLAGVIAGLLLVWLPPLEITAIVGLWLTGFSFGPIYPTTIAIISRIMPARLVPASIGFMSSAGGAGAALFPWLAGNLAERVGLSALLPFVILISLLMLACWIALQSRPLVQPLVGDSA